MCELILLVVVCDIIAVVNKLLINTIIFKLESLFWKLVFPCGYVMSYFCVWHLTNVDYSDMTCNSAILYI